MNTITIDFDEQTMSFLKTKRSPKRFIQNLVTKQQQVETADEKFERELRETCEESKKIPKSQWHNL